MTQGSNSRYLPEELSTEDIGFLSEYWDTFVFCFKLSSYYTRNYPSERLEEKALARIKHGPFPSRFHRPGEEGVRIPPEPKTFPTSLLRCKAKFLREASKRQGSIKSHYGIVTNRNHLDAQYGLLKLLPAITYELRFFDRISPRPIKPFAPP